jgi:hypothetical protein
VPAPTAVINPPADTVATVVFELDHDGVPRSVFPLPSFATATACVVCPTVNADDGSVTVTVAEPPGAVTRKASDPTIPSLDAEMTAVPAATPVTTPVLETDATLGAELDHVMVRPVRTRPCPSFSVAVAVVDWPTASVVDGALTVTDDTGATGVDDATVNVIDPLFPSLVAVTIALPAPSAVTAPLGATDTAERLLLDQEIERPLSTLPCASRSVTVTGCD